MPFSTYADLKQAIERFSHRTDISDVIDDFIDLAENRIDKELQLRDNEIRVQAAASTASRFLALPDRFLEMRMVELINGSTRRELEFKSPSGLRPVTRSDTSSIPRFFTVTSQLEFDVTPASAYTIEMNYFAGIIPLDATNTSNDVLTNYPDLYLYGALAELYTWAGDMDQLSVYEQKFAGAIRKANQQEKRGRYGPAPAIQFEGLGP